MTDDDAEVLAALMGEMGRVEVEAPSRREPPPSWWRRTDAFEASRARIRSQRRSP